MINREIITNYNEMLTRDKCDVFEASIIGIYHLNLNQCVVLYRIAILTLKLIAKYVQPQRYGTHLTRTRLTSVKGVKISNIVLSYY